MLHLAVTHDASHTSSPGGGWEHTAGGGGVTVAAASTALVSTHKTLLCCQTDGFWPHNKVVVFICVTIRKLSVLSNGQTFSLGGTNDGIV